MLTGRRRWLGWFAGSPTRPQSPSPSDLASLRSLRARVFSELSEVRALKALFAGTPDRATYVRYLINAYHYAQYSPKVMALAASRCTDTHPELATYLLRHADEEQGHHRWALDDLRDLGTEEVTARTTRPVSSCSAMIGYVHYVALHANPVGLFGWMYVLEAVGSDLGSAAAQRLKASFGSGDRAMRFVARHGVSDVDHAKELEGQIAAFIRHRDLADVCYVAEVVADLYVRMFREIGGERPEWR